MSYVAAFRTYTWDDGATKLAQRFFSATPSGFHVVLADETKGPLPIPGYPKVSHTEDASCFGLPTYPRRNSLWYNVDYGVYFLRKQLPSFDYYLLSESDLAVNIDCEPIVAQARKQHIDFICHDVRRVTADWVWRSNARAAFADPWRSLLFFMLLSGRAIDALLAARKKLAIQFAAGQLVDWPFCESFVPTVLTSGGFRVSDLGEFALVDDLKFRPRISLRDPRANRPGSLVHSVLGQGKFVQTILAEGNPRDYFDRESELRKALAFEPFGSIVGPLRKIFTQTREHACLVQLERDSVMHGLPSPEKRDNDLASCKPALTSSTCEWSHFADAQRDACGANGAALPDDYGFHTAKELNPWWMVDLIDECLVEEIAIVNRRTYQDRFRSFVIQSSRDGSAWLTRYAKLDLEHISPDPAAPWRHTFLDPFVARYVRIVIPGQEMLHLRRVQVFGRSLSRQADTGPAWASTPTKSSSNVLFVQTADIVNYAPLLDATSRTIREYCKRYDCAYESYLGIVRGYYAWQATYNRIPILRRLLDTGFRGWVCYIDADAYVADLHFDIRAYLSERQHLALLIAQGGPPPPWWNVNAGVFLLNFDHPLGRAIVSGWSDRFNAISDEELRSFTDWNSAPEDQWLLAQTLRDLPHAEQHTMVDRDDPPLLNYSHGRFIRQHLRAYGSLPERLSQLRSAVDRVLEAGEPVLAEAKA